MTFLKIIGVWCLALLAATPLAADTVVATRTIRSQSIITGSDLATIADNIPGAWSDPAELIGKEARIVLYAGRPIRLNDVGEPALIERNSVVTLIYRTSGLNITTEGRAMGRAGAGEKIKVMNLSSRAQVFGEVQTDGSVLIR